MPLVTIDTRKYEADSRRYLMDLYENSFHRDQDVFSREYDLPTLAEQAAKLLEDPTAKGTILSKDAKGINALVKVLLDKSRKLLYAGNNDSWEEYHDLVSTLMDYTDVLARGDKGAPTWEETEAQAEESIKENLDEVVQSAEALQDHIKAALSRIPNWGGSAVVISASFHKGDGGVSHTLQVEVGEHEANFTVFTEGDDITGIDDVLEGGDRDFFSTEDPQEQADYFNLIQELRNPGSSSQGKRVTLYTARPTKDRRLYEKATHVPVNIFMTTDPDRAVGLATDLGGSEERDVWKVKINSQYLVMTLDAGRMKDYQVVGGERTVPVERIEMIYEGGASRVASRVASRWLSGI